MLKNLIIKFNEKGSIYIKIKAKPGSSKTEIKEIMEDSTIKIALAAQPIKNQANQELIDFLSKIFNCKKINVRILSGVAEKIKLVKISNKL
jgi:hypothetical protein